MKWNELSMADRARYIKLGVQNGITNLNHIRDTYNSYNSFDGGGKLYDISALRTKEQNNELLTKQLLEDPNDKYPGDYLKWKKSILKHKGINIDSDNTYDYLAFYFDNPVNAWNLLSEEPKAHFPDKFKTIYHPTFSDESIYSTPEFPGGHWNSENTFQFNKEKYPELSSFNPLETLIYLSKNDSNVILLDSDGNPYVRRDLPEVTVTPEEWQYDFIKNFGDSNNRKQILRDINNNVINEIDNAIDRALAKATTSEEKTEIYNRYDKAKSESSVEKEKRLYNIWNYAGRTKLDSKDDFFNILAGKNRAHINMLTNKANSINSLSDAVAELSHPIQMKHPSNWLASGNPGAQIINALWSLEELFGSYKRYDTPGSNEYDTHTVIQPQLYDYIYTGKYPDFLNVEENNKKAEGGGIR